MALAIEIVASDRNRCGEGPIWDAEKERLLWTDIESQLVYELYPETGRKAVISRQVPVSAIALNEDGGLVFGGAAGLFHFHGNGRARPIVSEIEGDTLVLNDLIAGPRGEIYAGTIYWGTQGMEMRGKLYLIEPGGRARPVDEGIELSNGLGFSPDGRTLYFTDSAARKIYAYEVNPRTGDLSRRRVLVSVPRDEGIPDGLTVDSRGYVWSAQWYGAQVVCYDPEGSVERRLPMPARQVSSLAFGGKDLSDLYITTAADPWTSDLAPPGYDFKAPNPGGSLYRARLDVQGKLEHLARF